jgi:hypothetical protein
MVRIPKQEPHFEVHLRYDDAVWQVFVTSLPDVVANLEREAEHYRDNLLRKDPSLEAARFTIVRVLQSDNLTEGFR